MLCTAVFVDAGYFFAQGSAVLFGEKKSRTELAFDAPSAIGQLRSFAGEKAPASRLLRIYWYDGAVDIRPTTDQASLASLDDVKLRLGIVNSFGQQKGVDSLIVTDLIELARLKSITDAVLVSGDEDVRIGVQIAQNYGVRVHLLGFSAGRRQSQSTLLMQESDTTSVWGAQTIRSFMRARDAGGHESASHSPGAETADQTDDAHDMGKITVTVQSFVFELQDSDIEAIQEYWKTARGVPPDLDKHLLPACGTAVGRHLSRPETKHMRSSFQRIVSERCAEMQKR